MLFYHSSYECRPCYNKLRNRLERKQWNKAIMSIIWLSESDRNQNSLLATLGAKNRPPSAKTRAKFCNGLLITRLVAVIINNYALCLRNNAPDPYEKLTASCLMLPYSHHSWFSSMHSPAARRVAMPQASVWPLKETRFRRFIRSARLKQLESPIRLPLFQKAI